MSHAHKLRHKAILKRRTTRHETDAANFSARLAPACADRDRECVTLFLDAQKRTSDACAEYSVDHPAAVLR